MLSRPDSNKYIATISITIADHNQYELNDKSITQLIEKLSFPIAQGFTHAVGAMAESINITIMRNMSNSAFGYNIIFNLLTDSDLSQEKEKNDKFISEAVKTCISELYQGTQLNLSISTIDYKVNPNNALKAKFRGKIDSKNFRFNQIGGLMKFNVKFIDENDIQLSIAPPKKNFQYNRYNLTEIKYEYQKAIAAPTDITNKLNKEVKGYVDDHKDCMPFYNSIKTGDYNQALRRACVAGNLALVIMLTKYNTKGELNLDFNQASINGKTPLDYALESKKQDLILFLKENHALDSTSLRLSAMETEEVFSPEFNYKPPQSTFERLLMGELGMQTSQGGGNPFMKEILSRDSLFSTHRPASEQWAPKAVVKEADLPSHYRGGQGLNAVDRDRKQETNKNVGDIQEIIRQNKLYQDKREMEQKKFTIDSQHQMATRQIGNNIGLFSQNTNTGSQVRSSLNSNPFVNPQGINTGISSIPNSSSVSQFGPNPAFTGSNMRPNGAPGSVGTNTIMGVHLPGRKL